MEQREFSSTNSHDATSSVSGFIAALASTLASHMPDAETALNEMRSNIVDSRLPHSASFLDILAEDPLLMSAAKDSALRLAYPPNVVLAIEKFLLDTSSAARVKSEIDQYHKGAAKAELIITSLINLIRSLDSSITNDSSDSFALQTLGLPLTANQAPVPRRMLFKDIVNVKSRGGAKDEKSKPRDKKESETDEEGNILTPTQVEDLDMSNYIMDLALSLGGSKLFTSLIRRKALSAGTAGLISNYANDLKALKP